MSITAISSSVAAIGGKATPPGPGEPLSDNSSPLNFAAVLAEQTSPAGQPLDTQLLSGIITQTSTAKNGEALPQDDKILAAKSDAESILAALSVPAGQSAAAIAQIGRNKEKADEDRATAASTDPTDPSLAAQYAIQLAGQTVPNRAPDNTDRSKLSITAQNADTLTKEGRSALLDQKRPTPETTSTSLASAAQAPSFAESRAISLSDAANTAILAGDATAGNSSNSPAFATTLAATAAANATATAANQAQQPSVTTVLNAPNWSHDFGTRVVWLAKNDQQVAQININPPQLGPVQISISLNGDQASATFTSPHPEVRQAIQDSLPQLREMFTTAGITLGQANVGTQLPSQNREAPYQFGNEARSSGENAILSPDSHSSSSPTVIPIQRGRGLVDLFA
jgi:flagellar hook-length control protein FliK